jgi:uncharacterized protein YjbI with pentapeptide repeats
MRILTEYVRNNADPIAEKPRSDIQAVLRVIGDRNTAFDKGQTVDLSGTYLDGAELPGDFAGTIWVGAHLRKAHLDGARLDGAHLDRVDLNTAHLAVAHMEGAFLNLADLSGANLNWAFLDAAHLSGANLRGAFWLTQEQVNAAYGDKYTQLSWPLVSPWALHQ